MIVRPPREHMNEPSLPLLSETDAEHRRTINRLLIFFAIVYLVEGVGQVGGLIAQPLSYYLKEVYGWTPLQVTAYFTIFNLPWVIKPLYGAFSDFVPIFGYRRKPYLIAANIAAAGAFFWVTQLSAPDQLVWALQITAYGMAISSTVCGAVLVENGQKLGESGRFVNQQWLWTNVAVMVGSVLGGELVQWLSPTSALHVTAALITLAPLAVLLGTIFLVPDRKTPIDLPGLRATFGGLVAAFKKRDLWVLALFLFLYYFSPGLSKPLYYYMTDSLKFSQGYIGILGSIAAAGWIVAALLYRRVFEHLSSQQLLNLSIALGTLATAAFVFLSGDVSAAILNFCSGFTAMLATVATVTLAADFCPPRSEGFTFAAMMSVINLSTSFADNVGSYLYEHTFGNALAPLILASAAFTALAFVLVPFLRLGDKRQGRVVTA